MLKWTPLAMNAILVDRPVTRRGRLPHGRLAAPADARILFYSVDQDESRDGIPVFTRFAA
jgi:hypothetical protein